MHVGIDSYMTLDASSGIEKLFVDLTQPKSDTATDGEMNGDSGGSTPHRVSMPKTTTDEA